MTAASRIALEFRLPSGYRPGDVLRFHERDAHNIAERVEGTGLSKGLLWQGRAARLELRFEGPLARAGLHVDGRGEADGADFEVLLRRMLGLDQSVEDFERLHGAHPLLGPVIRANRGLRVPVSASPFEALAWAITGQQISLGAAISIRRRLILACGQAHSSGLLCHPGARDILALGETGLRACGFSQAKAAALLRVCDACVDGHLPLEGPRLALHPEEAQERLLAIKGIGPWTVSYALLRGFGWLDGSLHGDVALRRNLQRLLGHEDKLNERDTEAWLRPWSPWRALVAAHLWAMQRTEGY